MSDEWVSEELSNLLLFSVPQDMIDYIKSITNEQDLEDYMKTLLDFTNPHHTSFFQELLNRRKGVIGAHDTNGVGYRKTETEEDYIAPTFEKKKKEKGIKSLVENPEQQIQTKKKKYVNLYSQEGRNREIVLLKGRHKCDCQAGKHQLINNCLKCGRIVCEQEGSGPCLFCGNLVCSRGEQELINAGSKHSTHLLQKLMDQKPAGYEAAIEQRNRLLEYDKTSEKRTRVIDDENDYFNTDSVWLSPREREKMRKKKEELQAMKHQSRKDRVVTLDIGLRRMVESTPTDEFDLSEMEQVLRDIGNVHSSNSFSYEGDNIDPSTNIQPRFVDEVKYDFDIGHRQSNYETECSLSKVQDREYLEMVDDGLCMSLHQPWASLLVSGIKKHEGRNWYTSHRGRLWIASAAKQVTEQEIKDTERLYTETTGSVVFPLTYPTGCLLGCVNLVNCLPQEEYITKYPQGESCSPYVFICDSPQELPIRFPIQGKHKIYKLDPLIHQAAQKALQRIAKIKSEKNSMQNMRGLEPKNHFFWII